MMTYDEQDRLEHASCRLAGVAVDVPLHPLDTLKTRVQSREGPLASRGLKRGSSS